MSDSLWSIQRDHKVAHNLCLCNLWLFSNIFGENFPRAWFLVYCTIWSMWNYTFWVLPTYYPCGRGADFTWLWHERYAPFLAWNSPLFDNIAANFHHSKCQHAVAHCCNVSKYNWSLWCSHDRVSDISRQMILEWFQSAVIWVLNIPKMLPQAMNKQKKDEWLLPSALFCHSHEFVC